MSKYTVEYADAEKLKTFYGSVVTQRSLCVMDGDEILVMAGLRYAPGGRGLFMDLGRKADRNSFKLQKMFFTMVPMLREMMDEEKVPVYSFPSDHPCAESFLEKVGLVKKKEGVWYC